MDGLRESGGKERKKGNMFMKRLLTSRVIEGIVKKNNKNECNINERAKRT
jgi:hypothetical protein